MLRELHELGKVFNLPPPGYSLCTVHWQIELSNDSIIPVLSEGNKGKIIHGKKVLVPNMRRNNTCPLLIDESGEYVFSGGERGKERGIVYRNLLTQCIADTQNTAAALVLRYVELIDPRQLDLLGELLPAGLNKKVSWHEQRFIFTKDGEQVTQIPELRRWWSKYYASHQETTEGECILTGDKTFVISRKTPMMVKGVPGSQSAGAALTSFDKPSSQSYGWSGAGNALISYEASINMHSTLEVLLNDPNHNYRSGEQVFVFWGTNGTEDVGINPEVWDDPGAALAKNIFTSADKPIDFPADFKLRQQFYLATLKGKQGRIAVTGWKNYTHSLIKINVRNFVTSQEYNPDAKAKPLWMLKNCAFREPKKEHTDPVATYLIENVLFGTPIPDNYGLKICDRICAEMDVGKTRTRTQALLLYLTSHHKNIMQLLAPTVDSSSPTSPPLNPKQIAFILGRICFLMHIAQVKAQNMTKEETNVSRSLRVLSTNPTALFPRLYQGCIAHHLVAEGLGYIRHYLDLEFGKLGSSFNPITDLPRHLDTQSQSCFFVGWGIRRSEFFAKKDKTDTANIPVEVIDAELVEVV